MELECESRMTKEKRNTDIIRMRIKNDKGEKKHGQNQNAIKNDKGEKKHVQNQNANQE